jgi:hypothetical protein
MRIVKPMIVFLFLLHCLWRSPTTYGHSTGSRSSYCSLASERYCYSLAAAPGTSMA